MPLVANGGCAAITEEMTMATRLNDINFVVDNGIGIALYQTMNTV